MNEKMEKVAALLNKANKDYKASKALLDDYEFEYHSDVICFHCQQCVEKSLKAFLIYNETAFPRTHDLLVLASICSVLDTRFKEFDLSEFSGFGVEIRYDDLSPTIEEAKQAFETAKVVMDYVKGCT